MKKLSEMEREILSALSKTSNGGGFATRHIAQRVTYSAGNNMQRSAAVHHRLKKLVSDGYVGTIDDLSPPIWCITDAGRNALLQVSD